MLPFASGSLDFVVATNSIHHVPYPLRFFDEARRVLRKGGHLLIHEVQASFLFCLVLRMMRHEGYSFDVNVMDRTCVCTDPEDLWSGNKAISRLPFDDRESFLLAVQGWEIVRDEACECLTFLNSSGVTAKTVYVPLPGPLLKVLAAVDDLLVN